MKKAFYSEYSPAVEPLPQDLTLARFQPSDTGLLMSWFSNRQDVVYWAGFNFPYPFDRGSFEQHLKLNQIPAFALYAAQQEQLFAFGQIMSAGPRCHLVRLAVDPRWRNRGLGKILLDGLCLTGQRIFQATEFTLFVNQQNAAALKLYQSAGFKVAKYEAKMPNKQSWFMKKQRW